ncbi:unnamed protein product [Ixodes persulcatus]
MDVWILGTLANAISCSHHTMFHFVSDLSRGNDSIRPINHHHQCIVRELTFFVGWLLPDKAIKHKKNAGLRRQSLFAIGSVGYSRPSKQEVGDSRRAKTTIVVTIRCRH